MLNIVVIGAGQLGSRHLQGLAKLSQNCVLHIVDPSVVSVTEAKKRINEINPIKINEVFSHDSVVTLPDSIQLAIIATTADTRLSALKDLCAHTSVQYLILEKVLFQQASHFKEAEKLLESNSIKCWVNCARRAYPVYIDLRDYFSTDPITCMHVVGGDWGMGCNAIHFLDLLTFFTGNVDFELDISHLDSQIRDSKRERFIEFTGSLLGKCGEATFSLKSTFKSEANHTISLYSERKLAVIDEVGSRIWKIDESSSQCSDFDLPFQSNLTTSVANSILKEGTCNLPRYDESLLVHMPFLKALSTHLGSGVSNGSVPIT
jgi:predicted dehydrogenase